MSSVPKTLTPDGWVSQREQGYDSWDQADAARVPLVNAGKTVRLQYRGGRYYVEWKK